MIDCDMKAISIAAFTICFCCFGCLPAKCDILSTCSENPSADRCVSLRIPSQTVQVQADTFVIGSDDSATDGEGPSYKAFISSFQADSFEVSNMDFADFVACERFKTTAEKLNSSTVFSPSASSHQVVLNTPWWSVEPHVNWRNHRLIHLGDGVCTHPVVHVSWYDAGTGFLHCP
jgi:formylglycine-generating enzyme required for sulfatase activity